jgi:DNA-binding GntR family transcriptional regulator
MSKMQTFDQETLHDRGIMHHFNILAALAKRDPQASCDALRADIADAADWWSQRIFSEEPEVPPTAKRGRKRKAAAEDAD